MDRENRKLEVWTFAMPLLLVVIVFAAMMAYRTACVKQQKELAYSNLQRTAVEQAVLLKAGLENQKTLLRACAVGAGAQIDLKNVQTCIRDMLKITPFYSLGLLDTSGVGYTSDGRVVDESSSDYFKKSISGCDDIEHLTIIDSRGTGIYVFSVPVWTGGKVTGVLYGRMTESNFRALMSYGKYSNEGTAFLCDKSGNIIINGENSSHLFSEGNITDILNDGVLDASFSSSVLTLDLRTGVSGRLAFNLGNEHQYAVYQPLGINDWMLFCVLKDSSVVTQADQLTQSGNLILIFVMLAFILVLVAVYMINARGRRQLESEQEQLRLSDARFRIALENGRVCIWDYDFATHSIIQAEHALALHGSDRVILNVPQSLVAGGIVHPDSASDFLAMYDRLQQGQIQTEGVFRIRRSDGGYWYQHIRYKTICDKRGKPYRAIGMAEDVTERYEAVKQYQKKLNQLSDLAQRDQLTGLLNRSAAEREINERLDNAAPECLNALYIIDLDGFKKVNDGLGHQRGDQTLTEIAQAIRCVFRSTDVVGRLGGDEFVVFLSAPGAPELIESRASELCDTLQFVYTGKKDPIHVTASVGIAACIGGGHTFAELYREADKALYCAKEDGRNRYAMSEETQYAAYRGEPAMEDQHTGVIQLKTLLEYMDGGVFLCEIREHPQMLYASPSLFNGIRPEQLSPSEAEKQLFSKVWHEDRIKLMDALSKGTGNGTGIDVTYRAICGGERLCWRHLHAVRVPCEHSTYPVMLGIVTDVSEQIDSRQEFYGISEHLRLAVEQNGLLFWETDPTGSEFHFWTRRGPLDGGDEGGCAVREKILCEILKQKDNNQQLRQFFEALYCCREEDSGIFISEENHMRFRLAYRMLYDSNGRAVVAVGMAELLESSAVPAHAN